MDQGKKIFDLIKKLYPINRCLTGKGVRQTLRIIKGINPKLKIKSVKSGSKIFDWIVPNEWDVNQAFILSPGGKKICDYNKNNLHLIQYSYPLKKKNQFE